MAVKDVSPTPLLTGAEASAHKTAWRVAASMLLAMAALNAFALLVMPDLVTNRALSMVVINVVLAVGLFGGKAWARIWTLLRAALGGILLVIFDIVRQDYFDMLLQIALSASLVIVLIGHPNKRRTILAAVLFAIAFLVLSALYTLVGLERLLERMPGG